MSSALAERSRFLPRRGLWKSAPAITHGILSDVSSALAGSSDLLVRSNFITLEPFDIAPFEQMYEEWEGLQLEERMRNGPEKKRPGSGGAGGASGGSGGAGGNGFMRLTWER